MTDDEFDSHTRQLLDHIDARIESADDDAKKVHQSISRFIEKASQIEEGVDDALELMAYNFMLTDQVLHDHLNVFSIISLLTILQADDAAARALVRHSATAKARRWVLSEWANTAYQSTVETRPSFAKRTFDSFRRGSTPSKVTH